MSKFTDQEEFVLRILTKEGDITKLKAMHYNIGNINAVIGSLRKKGYDIGTMTRTDAQGRAYNEWTYIRYDGRDMRPTAVAKRYAEHRAERQAFRPTVVGGVSMSESLANAVTTLAPRGLAGG